MYLIVECTECYPETYETPHAVVATLQEAKQVVTEGNERNEFAKMMWEEWERENPEPTCRDLQGLKPEKIDRLFAAYQAEKKEYDKKKEAFIKEVGGGAWDFNFDFHYVEISLIEDGKPLPPSKS